MTNRITYTETLGFTYGMDERDSLLCERLIETINSAEENLAGYIAQVQRNLTETSERLAAGQHLDTLGHGWLARMGAEIDVQTARRTDAWQMLAHVAGAEKTGALSARNQVKQ